MLRELDRLEREADELLAGLAPHLRVPPPPAAVARVRSAVSAEVRRLEARRQRLVALRPLAGLAAAVVLLAVGLRWPRAATSSAALLAAGEGPAAAFEKWVDALEESGDRFASLLEADWLLDALNGDAENTGAPDPFESLDQSLQSLEQVVLGV